MLIASVHELTKVYRKPGSDVDVHALRGVGAGARCRSAGGADGSERREDGDQKGKDQAHEAPGFPQPLLQVPRIEAARERNQEGEQRPIDAGSRFDHVRQVALVLLLVEVGEVLAAGLLVGAQVEVGAIGDALQLGPPQRARELVLDVGRGLGVVGELVGVVRDLMLVRAWPGAGEVLSRTPDEAAALAERYLGRIPRGPTTAPCRRA